ncbi:MAG TPA: winged helix-turn-helix domain-containing protein [Caulobacteraceae bacterium]|nr:winged helix-turn-helix domain-containing protein [Caulobacteraceae bacterium]
MRRFADQTPMMGGERPDVAARPVVLAREADFALGGLAVRPSLREVTADGRRDVLEPRVMQVLVALSRMDGQVISRDELIDACWGGRIVGEDAINRCIGRLRRLSETLGGFSIETVARVGYRLTETGAAPSAATRPGPERRMMVAAGLVAATFVIAVGGAFGWRLGVPPRWTVESSRLLVSAMPIERHPALSPDGLFIAYSAGADVDTRQIYLRALAGGDPVKLTDEPGDHTSAAWSPDGKELAYVVTAPGAPCRIMIRPLRDGAARTAGDCITDDRSQVVWSRDGAALFFTDRPNGDAADRIVRLDLASGRRTDLTRPPGGVPGDRSLGLSPDGRYISFERSFSDLVAPLVIRDLKTGAERVIPKGWDLSPGGWTGDSRAVLLAGRVNGDNVIWAYPADGGPPQHLLSGPMQLGRIATGPHEIAAVEVNSEVYNLASPPSAAGGPPRILDASRAIDGAPAIAPDGDVAMAGARAGEAGVWLRRPGGAFQELVRVEPDVYLDGPAFSPDGQKLAFPTEASGRLVIRIVSITGQSLGQIPFAGAQLGVPAWDADGRSLIFPGRDAGGWRLYRVALAPIGAPVPASPYGWMTVQARGRELYGVRADSPGVWRIDGTPRRITTLPRPGFPNLWAIDGANIDYVDDPFGHPARIMRQPIAGGPPRVVAEAPGYAYDKGFAVDPATGAVIYAATLSDATDLELLKLGLT